MYTNEKIVLKYSIFKDLQFGKNRLLMLPIIGQILLLNDPIFKVGFRESGDHHKDNDGDVETGEDVIEPILELETNLSQ
jgi:hypothetical protein